MSKGNTFENDLLLLIFQATAIANIADNAGSGPLTSLYVATHTSDPGEAGTQGTNEYAYGSYARQTVTRSGAGWSVSANQVTPVANIDFPEAASGTETITHFSIGTSSAATSKILYSGTVTPNISVVTGVTPRLTTATAITED